LYNSQNISIYDLRTIKHLGLIKVGLTISDVYYVNDLLYAGDIYGTIWCYDLNGTLQYFHEHAHDG
jgi:Tfp pilus tip-associated adhesin PilY1